MKPHIRKTRDTHLKSRTVSELAVALKTGLAPRMEAALDDGDLDEVRDCIGLMVELGEAIAARVKMNPSMNRPVSDDEVMSALERSHGDISDAAALLGMTYGAFYTRMRKVMAQKKTVDNRK